MILSMLMAVSVAYGIYLVGWGSISANGRMHRWWIVMGQKEREGGREGGWCVCVGGGASNF